MQPGEMLLPCEANLWQGDEDQGEEKPILGLASLSEAPGCLPSGQVRDRYQKGLAQPQQNWEKVGGPCCNSDVLSLGQFTPEMHSDGPA